MTKDDVVHALAHYATSAKAKSSAWFFKTGPGQYGEGDVFIGVTVPDQRRIAKQFRALPVSEVSRLLASPIHEHRLVALFILVDQYRRADTQIQRVILDFYIEHLDRVNNWDLVDSSAPYILGEWIVAHPDDEQVLTVLAGTGDLWRERVAILATLAPIKKGRFHLTLKLAKQFLTHSHDLIHKATGWMLREVGKKDVVVLKDFLNTYAAQMPRTMLRYAIEKLPDTDRQRYLKQTK